MKDTGQYDAYIKAAIIVTRDEHGVNVPLWLVKSQIAAESSFDPMAVSHCGAKGLMQLMDATAKDMGHDPKRMFEPVENIMAGVKYLGWLTNRQQCRKNHRPYWPWVLAAYNCGPGNVGKYKANPEHWPDVQKYVSKIMKAKPEDGSEYA